MQVKSLYCFVVVMSSVLGGMPHAQAFTITRCNDQTVEEAWNDATAVFSGTVTRVRRLSDISHIFVDVRDVWKGPAKKEMKLRTARSDFYGILRFSVGEGYPFEEDEEYLIYTYHIKAGPQRVSSCSRTKPLRQAATDLARLGAPFISYRGDE